MRDEAIVEIQRVARRFGIDIRRHQPSHVERMAALCAREGVTLVADVGANVGDWGRAIRDAGYRGRLVSLEPLSVPFARLEARAARDPQWTALRCAAGAESGSATINVSEASQSSSLLDIQPAHLEALDRSRYVGTEDITVRRLDEALAAHAGPGDRLFVKLDVQGFEDQALAGLGDLLASVRALQAELALAPLYAGQPDWRELVARLEGQGFDLFMLEPAFVNPQTGQTLQVDGVFVRR